MTIKTIQQAKEIARRYGHVLRHNREWNEFVIKGPFFPTGYHAEDLEDVINTLMFEVGRTFYGESTRHHTKQKNPRTKYKCFCGRMATKILKSSMGSVARVCPSCYRKYSDPGFVAEGPYSKIQRNPKRVLIYGKVNRVVATKTQKHICDAACKRHGHRYFHDFSSNAQMYGLPDGSLLIKAR